MEDLIAEEEVVVTISHDGYIKRTAAGRPTARRAAAAGASRGSDAKEGDFVEHLFVASTHDYLLFFTNNGPRATG